MPAYFIGYDLHEGEDYTDLEAAIRKLSNGSWWHRLDSTWIIVHTGDASDIRDALLPYLVRPNEAKTAARLRGDKLLVAKLSGESAWTSSFEESGRKWLKSNL